MSECFNLSWRDFETCTSTVFKELLKDELFTDVTLACEDNKQIKAHKVILSSCSSFFKNVFINNPHEHMLIYLKGVKMAELTSIIRFVYLGETEVGQDDLDHFMAAAEGLEIKGLMSVSNRSKVEEGRKDVFPNAVIESDTNKSFEDRNATAIEEGDIHKIEGQIENILNSLLPNDVLNIVNEDNLLFTNTHGKSEKHDLFPCEQCNYKASRVDHLKRHTFSVHENGRMQCNQCDFSATRADNLKRHINRIHISGNDVKWNIN